MALQRQQTKPGQKLVSTAGAGAASSQRRLSWTATDEWLGKVRSAATAEAKQLRPLLRRWDLALKSHGQDPSRESWADFRPLRVNREEAWSDWLQFLMQSPEGHRLATRLFPPMGRSAALQEVRREFSVAAGKRRADLVLLWHDRRASHVEVKIWDEHYAKTKETGEACRRALPGYRDWADYVLLPEECLEGWNRSKGKGNLEVGVVTWTSVCRELRKGLLQRSASHRWRAFARVFCGAVEQSVLGVPPLQVQLDGLAHSSAVLRFGRLLREALDHDPA